MSQLSLIFHIGTLANGPSTGTPSHRSGTRFATSFHLRSQAQTSQTRCSHPGSYANWTGSRSSGPALRRGGVTRTPRFSSIASWESQVHGRCVACSRNHPADTDVQSPTQDWHIDFAGSSVYYHILHGAKVSRSFINEPPMCSVLIEPSRCSISSDLPLPIFLHTSAGLAQKCKITRGWVTCVMKCLRLS